MGKLARSSSRCAVKYQSALAQENSLTQALSQQKGEALSMNRKAINYGVLQRDVDASKQPSKLHATCQGNWREWRIEDQQHPRGRRAGASARTGDSKHALPSTGPREGKSMVAGNMAVGLAQAGQRVLLIDVDVRTRVLREDRLTMGRFARPFEEEFAAKFGVKHAMIMNSGSSANLVGAVSPEASSTAARR